MKPAQTAYATLADVLIARKPNKNTLTHEFQYYGTYLAKKLEDKAHTTLYMKLARETDRTLLEQALHFVWSAVDVKNKAALFMWKLTKLKVEQRKRNIKD